MLLKRINNDDCYLISPSESLTPISFYDINHWIAAIRLFPDYITEIPLTENNSTFDPNKAEESLYAVIGSNGYTIEYLILRDKLAMVIDDGSLIDKIKDFIDNNQDMVKQYSNGNTKIVNSILGRFLKDNKGHDPQSVKTAIENELIERTK